MQRLPDGIDILIDEEDIPSPKSLDMDGVAALERIRRGSRRSKLKASLSLHLDMFTAGEKTVNGHITRLRGQPAFSDIANMLEQEGLTRFNLLTSEHGCLINIERPRAAIILSDERCLVYSDNLKTFNLLRDRLQPLCRAAVPESSVLMFSSNQGMIDMSMIRIPDCELLLENYSPNIAEKLQALLEWVDTPSKESGGIAILYGPPGGGKTYALRGLITASQTAQWGLLPSSLVPNLSGPDMIQTVLNYCRSRPMVMVVEDADELISDRKQPGVSKHQVSELLNFGDGIAGSATQMKLILTTNMQRTDIDEAVQRSGRLFSFTELGPLSAEHASGVYKRLTGQLKNYTQQTMLCDVYRDARGQGAEEVPYAAPHGQYM